MHAAGVGRRLTAIGLLAVWVALVVVGRVWGLAVVRDAPEPLYVDAVPFYGVWQPPSSAPLLLAGRPGDGARAWCSCPGAGRRLGWTRCAPSVVVSAVGRRRSRSRSSSHRPTPGSNIHGDYGQYTHFVDEQGPGGFLRDYTDRQHDYPTHLSAHPPGMTVLCCGPRTRSGWAAPPARSAPPWPASPRPPSAVLVALREARGGGAGPGGRRRSSSSPLPRCGTPTPTWCSAASPSPALALLAVATGRDRRASTVVGARRRRPARGGDALLPRPGPHGGARPRRDRRTGAGGASRPGRRPVRLARPRPPLAWGYSWLGGLFATKDVYDATSPGSGPTGTSWSATSSPSPSRSDRPRPSPWPGSATGARGCSSAVASPRWSLADLSGLSLAETERIWQPFMPLVLVAGGVLALGRSTGAGRWLALQAVTTIALVAFLRSPW